MCVSDVRTAQLIKTPTVICDLYTLPKTRTQIKCSFSSVQCLQAYIFTKIKSERPNISKPQTVNKNDYM